MTPTHISRPLALSAMLHGAVVLALLWSAGEPAPPPPATIAVTLLVEAGPDMAEASPAPPPAALAPHPAALAPHPAALAQGERESSAPSRAIVKPPQRTLRPAAASPAMPRDTLSPPSFEIGGEEVGVRGLPSHAETAPEPPVEAAAPADPVVAAPTASDATQRQYLARLLAWLERHREYPATARQRDIEGRAVVRFRLDDTGRLGAHGIERSAGHGILDEAALVTLRRADPMPAPPDGYPSARLEFVLPMEFRLH